VSYILDALRKSDAQRRRGAPPPLVAPLAAAEPARPRRLWWGLAAAALLGIGVLIGALRPWQTNGAPPGVPAPAEPPLAKANPPSPAAAAVPTEPVTKPIAALPKRAPKAPAAKPATKAAKAPSAESTSEAPLVRFGELPVPVQEEIPKLKIGAHAYSSEPRNRLVSIDDRVLHEGDEVAPGLKLERITPEGLIMTYKGYRFLRAVH
jgi:general secretion pathway protein B